MAPKREVAETSAATLIPGIIKSRQAVVHVTAGEAVPATERP